MPIVTPGIQLYVSTCNDISHGPAQRLESDPETILTRTVVCSTGRHVVCAAVVVRKMHVSKLSLARVADLDVTPPRERRQIVMEDFDPC